MITRIKIDTVTLLRGIVDENDEAAIVDLIDVLVDRASYYHNDITEKVIDRLKEDTI